MVQPLSAIHSTSCTHPDSAAASKAPGPQGQPRSRSQATRATLPEPAAAAITASVRTSLAAASK